MTYVVGLPGQEESQQLLPSSCCCVRLLRCSSQVTGAFLGLQAPRSLSLSQLCSVFFRESPSAPRCLCPLRQHLQRAVVKLRYPWVQDSPSVPSHLPLHTLPTAALWPRAAAAGHPWVLSLRAGEDPVFSSWHSQEQGWRELWEEGWGSRILFHWSCDSPFLGHRTTQVHLFKGVCFPCVFAEGIREQTLVVQSDVMRSKEVPWVWAGNQASWRLAVGQHFLLISAAAA